MLRRYNPWREDIPYEHRVLKHLAERGWPVAAPIPTADADDLIDIDGDKYALFPWLRGHPQPSNPRSARTRGAILARLHADLSPLASGEQRVGISMTHEYATCKQAPNGRSFEQVLPSFVRAHPALGRRLAGHHIAIAEIVRALRELRTAISHADFGAWNVLFERGELTGIIDFDFTRLDLRMADIAAATQYDGHVGMWSAFIGAYAAVSPLSEEERGGFVALRMAHGLLHAASALSWWETGRQDMVAQVEFAVRELDRAEAQRDELIAALDSIA